MSRDWIALYASVLDSDTWAELRTTEARLGWIVTLLLAAQQSPEGCFDSVEQLLRLLGKEGITRPAPVVSKLIEVGAIEVQDGVRVRGWDRWQKRYRGPSDEPGVAAERMRRLRADRKDEEASSTVFDRVRPGSIEERRVEEIRGEESRARGPVPDSDRDSLDRFYELTQVRPWGKASGRWLREMEKGYGLEWTAKALDVEWLAKRDASDLLSRVDARLSRAADQRKQAEAEKPKAAAAAVDPVIEEKRKDALREMVG